MESSDEDPWTFCLPPFRPMAAHKGSRSRRNENRTLPSFNIASAIRASQKELFLGLTDTMPCPRFDAFYRSELDDDDDERVGDTRRSARLLFFQPAILELLFLGSYSMVVLHR